jgi:tRNA G18 (ribose-2'-O)-methylase SpoU
VLRKRSREIFAILPNVRSAHNVGSIFRTADAVGVSKIYLCGVTPVPGQRGRAGRDLAKTALGAEVYLPWEKHSSAAALIKKLKQKKVRVVALEQSKNAIIIGKYRPKFPLAILLGNEVRGIPPRTLRLVDDIIQIPMLGKKESLNVAVAAGIALFHLRYC